MQYIDYKCTLAYFSLIEKHPIKNIMKKVLQILLIFSTIAFITSSFKTQNDGVNIIKALKTADAEEVAAHFDKILDLKLPEKDEIKSIGKNQAGLALKSFFSENSISGFDLTSQRELGGTMYITGKLLDADKGYNLTLMLKNKGGKQQIITVRIN
jgi:hypothetical protein